MTAAEVKTALLTAATKMKRGAPQEWGVFLNALSAHAEMANQQLLGADPSSILHAQGRALALHELCISLADAEQLIQGSTRPRQQNGM